MLVAWINGFVNGLHCVLTGKVLPEAHRRDGELLLCLFCITCLAFGFEITNPTLGLDDYTHFGMNFEWNSFWISRGMWGGLLLQYLLPGGWITPFIELIIGIFIQCLSAIVAGWLLHLHKLTDGQRFVSYALFTTFPYFAAQMAFSYLQIGYSLATFLCIAALLMSKTNSVWRSMLASILMAFAISIYQGCISVLVTGAVLYFAFSLVYSQSASGGEHTVKKSVAVFSRMTVTVIVGAALYYMAHKSILAYTGLPAGEGYYAVTFDIAFWKRWASIVYDVCYLLSGADGLVPHIAQLLFFVVVGCVAIQLVFVRKNAKFFLDFPVVMVLLAILLVSPFFVLFLHEGGLAPRSSIGVGLLWLAAWAMAQKISRGLSARILSAAAFLVVCIFLFQNNRMFYSEYLVEQADAINVTRMEERIAMLDAQNGEQDIQGAVVLGTYSHPVSPPMVRYCGSVLGYSMFELDSENPQNALIVLTKAHGLDHHYWYGPSKPELQFDTKAVVANRKPWPHADAVFLQDGWAVLWLGERRTDCGEGSFQDWLASWFPAASS
ncbi:MAG TPA: glucosyltransferase domain-containing protein [Pseudomonadales bacterium]|nr:glucosyltransferase domain-containing protein [Pseudomonadales bacterium]